MSTLVLHQLVQILRESVDEIDSILTKNSSGLPSLDEPIASQEEILVYSQIQGAATKIKSACGQLAASVSPPAITIADAYWGYLLSASVKVVGTINAAEILREAGPQGLHVRGICEPSGTDPAKIARVLRLLATHHIFREITPDVFANNRISSLLDSGNSVKDLFRPDAKRSDKFLSPGGAFSAYVEFMVDDMFTAATKLTECLTEQQTAKSAEPTEAPVNIAFKTRLPVMEWQQLPDNELRMNRFDVAMSISARGEGSLQGLNWKEMTPGSSLVDVGGGFGALFLNMAREHKHLRYIVADQATVIQGAKAFWERTNPEALEPGRVKFQEIDFFAPNPIKDASVFILRKIMHDWSDQYAVRILRNLREAAQPTTKLFIIDEEVPLACKDPFQGTDAEVTRKGFPEWFTSAPGPLLPNYGTARVRPYFLDLLMLTFNNGQERTMSGFQKITREAGWKIDEVHFIQDTFHLQIVAIPV